jgi:hypothetical protein
MKEMYNRIIWVEDPNSNSKPNKGIKDSKVHNEKDRAAERKKSIDKTSYFFFENIKESLMTKNENHVKWYTEIIQCLYQYHPEMVIRDFNQIEKIIICLLKEWDNSTFTEIALDMIFNLILCLSHIHYDWT